MHRFRAECERNDMLRFADAMTALAVEVLGIRLPETWGELDTRFANRILDDIFSNEDKVYNRSRGKWLGRIHKLRNMLRYRWKYEQIYRRSILAILFNHAFRRSV